MTGLGFDPISISINKAIKDRVDGGDDDSPAKRRLTKKQKEARAARIAAQREAKLAKIDLSKATKLAKVEASRVKQLEIAAPVAQSQADTKKWIVIGVVALVAFLGLAFVARRKGGRKR